MPKKFRDLKMSPFADSDQRKVFDQILSNAIQFTKEDGTITVSLERRGDRIAASVSDDGIGILR